MHFQESWRHFFYYTFGLLPSLFFTLRFLIQWISSEKRKESFVTKTFWSLSLCGNCLLCLHYFIQLQYLLMLIQVINGFISWRNLDLMSVKHRSFRVSLAVLITSLFFSSLLFFSQFIFVEAPLEILSIPFGLLKDNSQEISPLWHLFGGAGCLLFASRFWIQWVEAERSGKSHLNKNFWTISIAGSSLALIYFFHIGDTVSCLNYSFGLIPYIRNLILFYKQTRA